MKERDEPLRAAQRTAIAEIRAIYREVDARPIDRNCIRRTECCQFRITGKVPVLTAGEALVAASALRAAGKTTLPTSQEGVCPMLEQPLGRCRIYADRPFGCRTHFCAAAGGPHARRDVIDLIRRMEATASQLGDRSLNPLPTAVAKALDQIR